MQAPTPWTALYPADKSWEAPLAPAFIADGLEAAAHRWPDAVALASDQASFTFAQLHACCVRVARGLQDIGVGAGTHVALLLKNTPSHVVCFYAVLLAGGRVVNLSASTAPAQLRQQLQDARAEVLIAGAQLRALLAPAADAADAAPAPRCVVCDETQADFAVDPAVAELPAAGDVTLAQLAASRGALREVARASALEEVAVLQYTGGTTGAPKAAMLTHANFSAIPHAMRLWAGDAVGAGRVLLVVLPLSHVFGLALMCLAVANGLKMVLRAGFDIDRTLRDVGEGEVSLFFGVPMMYAALAANPRTPATDWSRVRVCGSGGAPLALDTFDAFRDATGCEILEGYSLTEIADLGTWQLAGCPPVRGKVGIPFPLTTVEIVDLDTGGTVLPPGETGEVCFRGPQLMRGYWNRPEETAHAMRGGRFHTGDVGRMDAQGYLTLVDRMKDMLIVAGHKVFSRRVEEAIAEHPAIAEACVVGMPSPQAGQLPRAVVALRPGQAAPTLADLQDFLRERLGRYELPMALDVLDELPRTAAGKVAKALLAQGDAPLPAEARADADATAQPLPAALARAICALFAEAGQFAVAQVTPHARLESYGMDSLTVVAVHSRLAQPFPELPSTVFYELATIAQLAQHIAASHPEAAARWLGRDAATAAPAAACAGPGRAASPARRTADRADDGHAIAIIGLSGRYAKARTLDAYWDNLKAGRDCISEIPPERWSLADAWVADPSEAIARGKSYCKWLGYLEGFADFDPLFFGISPRDALAMDPQERLFVQSCWEALEDAAYTRDTLARRYAGSVGVFAGITNMGYDLYGPDLWARGHRLFPYTWFSSLANRVSYLLDLHGPSMPVDTMCSSSLTAIHEACQHIRRGECELALAGGVNLYVHPAVHSVLCMRRMLSVDGRSKSFGAGANGYAPGEGAGVVVLKRLSRAIADGDHIHAVIRGSAINHGGRTNGYTVPSPAAQRALIRAALADAGVNAREVSCIEAHGTGTELGDPIEIAGLHQAFSADTGERGFCAIGSVKSNVGHCESAAGMAGLTKLILQMQHGQLVPSLHADTLNPRIDFEPTAFRLQRELAAWPRPRVEVDGQLREMPRIAGISSFGAGGSNAHLVLQEYAAPAGEADDDGAPVLLVLSAPSRADLRARAGQLEAALAAPQAAGMRLADVAYTLQVGREPMRCRLAFVSAHADDLRECLANFARDDHAAPGVRIGELEAGATMGAAAPQEPPPQLDAWLRAGDLDRLAEAWAAGSDVDWEQLPRTACRRVSLPAYRFGGERYWVADILKDGDAKAAAPAQAQGLHPLVHRNTSHFGQQRFSSRFDGREFFLHEHKLQGRALLPAMALPEIVRVALAQSAGADAPQDRTLVLQDVAWLRPFVVDGAPAVLHVELGAAPDGTVSFTLIGDGTARETFARGRARLNDAAQAPVLDLAALRARCAETIPVAEAYAVFRASGLEYGPTFHVLDSLEAGTDADGGLFALGRLALPADAERMDALDLHPAVLDGAIQTAAGLSLGRAGRDAGIGFTMPFALQSLEMLRPLPTGGVFAVVRRAAGASAAPGMSFLDMDLACADGTVHVRIRGLAGRSPVARAQPALQAAQTARAEHEAPAAQPVLFRPRRETLALPPAVGIIAREHLIAHASLDAVDTGRDAPQAVVTRAFPSARSIDLRGEPGAGAPPFEQQAARLFALLKELAQAGKPVLLQVVAPAGGADATLAGLQGLLASAALESPQVTAQLLQVEADTTVPQTVDAMRRFAVAGSGAVRVAGDALSIERFAEDVPHAPAARPWRDGAVYFISGGAGAIGLLFADDIAQHAHDAAVVLTSRRAPSPEQARRMDALRAQGLRVLHLCMDVADADAVRRAIAETLARFGRLDGVLHAAGVVRDNLLARKSAAEFGEVLAPKAAGVRHLDEATRTLPLAFFACFSSTAALGNVGQADYAAANAFLDAYAAHRNALAARGQRHGRTVSVNWPLWEAGGMTVGAAALARMSKEWGVVPLPSSAAMEAFAHALDSGAERLVVTYGEAGKLRRALAAAGAVAIAQDAPVPAPAAPATPAADGAQPADPALVRRTEELLRQVLAKTAALEPERIEAEASFDNYGIDSILIMDMTEDLEKTLGPLSKTLFFEYPSIARLARQLAASHGARLAAAFGLERAAAIPPVPAPVAAPVPAAAPVPVAAPAAAPPPHDAPPGSLAIAVIGVAGRYPGAEDVAQFWDNLRAGKDSVTEIPLSRWDHSLYFDAERGTPGTTYGKWGGFIEDVNCFDPLFFNIAPREAEIMDPQERLFLQCTYSALEDAGYTRDMLGDRADPARARRVGVFVGVMSTEFQLFGAQEQVRGNNVALTGSAASIANRVSYFLDVSGPSMAVDTMCSSSLTAIELACQSIRYGRCKMAIAGGVNLTLHPNKYLMLAQGRFVSSTGQCASFGQGGDGYVPGEGVGALVLKPLEAAVADGDQVYGVILATATNHGGKANGYTVPNPNAQAAVIADCLDAAGVDARELSYLEAHGTGTTLGDPIEIAGLARAFSAHTQDRQFCAIGSVKSNIGHCEGAAGVAGVTKVLLQLRHGMLAPSLHAATLNPNIDFAGTPFAVQRSLAPWPAPARGDGAQPPRVAGVSSFGAGGSNAHVILREYRDAAPVDDDADEGPFVIVLSARDRERLDQRCADLLAWLQRPSAPTLAAVACTLQTGREEMPCRLAFVAASLDEVRARLALAARPGDVAGIERADLRGARRKDLLLHDEDDFAVLVEGWIAKRKHDKLAVAWVRGHAIPWRRLYGARAPRRVSLPAYPFARIVHTIPQVGSKAGVPAAVPAAVPVEAAAGTTLAMVARWETVPDLLGARWPEAPSQAVLVHAADEPLAVPPAWAQGLRRVALQGGDTVESVAAKLAAAGAFEHLVWLVPRAASGAADDQFAVIADGLRLVKALDTLGHAGRKLGMTVLSFHAQALSGDERIDTAAAGVHGFVGSLAKERTRWAIRLIDAEDGAPPAFDALLRVPADASGNAVVHRAGRWHRQVLLACDLPAAGPGLVPGGVYVVIGGAGGLGRAFSEHLVRSVRGQPVWVGRRPQDEGIAAAVRETGALGVAPLYLSADASVPAQLQEVRRRVLAEFGRIDGIVLTAMGATDKALQDTDAAQLRRVLAPKLDVPLAAAAAFGDLPVRHWILFSSNNAFGKGAGNAGYSAGCTFLDAFAHQLRQQVAGDVKLMHWGYWGEVGIGRSVPESFKKRMALAGIGILQAPEAMAALDALLCAPQGQMVFQRNTKPEATDHLGCFRSSDTVPLVQPAEAAPAPVPANDAPAGVAAVLTARLAAVLKIDAKELDGGTAFSEVGIDSISSAEFADAANAALRIELQPVDILSHPTIAELSAHVLATWPALAVPVPAPPEVRAAPAAPAACAAPALIAAAAPASAADDDAIAIVGLRGVHPGGADLDAHWRNLEAGADCIGEIDAAWSTDCLFHPDPATAVASGRNYCRWGGRLDPLWAAGFDAALIPAAMAFGELHPVEAMFLRGIQELVRECGHAAWSAERRDAARMGLFICGSGGPLAGQGASADWSGGLRANRISFMFDLRGPSMAVDTMSSSSLAAVHAACTSLRRGECRSAIAGGFAILSPDYYRQASALRFLGSRATSRSFTAGDGYLPAECAGAVLLKTLRHAREDGDRVLAVLRSTVASYAGRETAPFLPSPRAQARLVEMSLAAAGVDARAIGYVESAANGAALGDAVEFASLCKVFGASGGGAGGAGWCALGSVKANIGHAAAASGISQLAKVVLQLQHRTLVPTPLAGPLNPGIRLEGSPFAMPREAAQWPRPVVALDGVRTVLPRRALLNSFGAGGSYVSAVVEEAEGGA